MSIMQPPPPQVMPQPQPPAPPPAPLATLAAKPLLSDEEFKKLQERVTRNYANMEPQRRMRLRTIKQYVGNSLGTAGDGPGTHDCVVNLLDQMVEVYMQKLISGNPQCLVLTNKLGLKVKARYFQLALNHVLKQINIRDSLKMGVLESLFSAMVMKVGVENPEYTARHYPFDVSAVPFVDAVWFEDFVFDTSVSRLSECKFFGDKYRESKTAIRADKRNDPSVVENVQNGPMTAYDAGMAGETASDLSGNRQGAFDGDDQEMVWLWAIFVPDKRVVVVYPVQGGDKPLRVEPWTGHPEGPYVTGMYKRVPNNIMPKPPAVDGAPLAALDNELFEKLGRQASRQKSVGFAPVAATADAEKIIRTEDGMVIAVTHTDAVKQMNFPGADQGNLTFEQVVKARASFEWGNLETMGGTATGADTLGQEQMLQQNASGRIQMMSQVIVDVTKACITAVAWYLWNDPLAKVSVMDNLPGTDIEMEIQWPKQVDEFGNEHDMREGEFNDLNFDIVPYSMTDKPPAQRLQIMNSVVQQLIPILPLLQQQGISLNVQAWLERLEQYTGLEELSDIIQMGEVPQPEEQTSNTQPPLKAPNTTRTYDRRSTKGGQPDSAAELVGSMPKAAPKGGVA